MKGREFVAGAAAGLLLALAVVIGVGAAGVQGGWHAPFVARLSSATSAAGNGGATALTGASQQATPLHYSLLSVPIAIGLALGVALYMFTQRRVSV